MDLERKKIELLENGYNFIEESMTYYEYAHEKVKYWSFAIFHAIQGLELLVKETLRREHPVLIYENVDSRKRTVSLELGLKRLRNIIGVEIDAKEIVMITKASKFRNLIIHYEFDLNNIEAKAIYHQLFEFLHYFHFRHLKGELTLKLSTYLHELESEIMNEFAKDKVFYNGIEMHKSIPGKIIWAQKWNRFKCDDIIYKRIPFGKETKDFIFVDFHCCIDCGVKVGQFHVEYCSKEQCPICREQLLSCECRFKALELDEEE